MQRIQGMRTEEEEEERDEETNSRSAGSLREMNTDERG